MSLYLHHDFLRVFFMSAINRYLEKPSDEKCKELEEAWETWFGNGNLLLKILLSFIKSFHVEIMNSKGESCLILTLNQIFLLLHF